MRTVPVAGWVMVIAAPTTTAPLESETVPRMPVSKDCDHIVTKLRVLTADAVNKKETHRFMEPPLCFAPFQGRTDLLCYGQDSTTLATEWEGPMQAVYSYREPRPGPRLPPRSRRLSTHLKVP